MRIKSLAVRNFRAITQIELAELQDTVVIAGPNGCGKSCVFDAIRLVKSVYGGYQPNEWQNWFGEFQININQRRGDWLVLLQDRSRPLEISAEFVLAEDERAYLVANASTLLSDQIWKEVAPELVGWRSVGATPLAAHLRAHQPKVEKAVAEALPLVLAGLAKPVHVGRVAILPSGVVQTDQSRVLELLFSQYDPQHLGIIDYHGANRNYGREQVGGVNLNIEASEERLRQHALYNYSSKYANLKTEMASSYVRHLLAQQAGGEGAADESLSDTLKELFTTFFPGKEFLGPLPTPDGRLQFPVRTANGSQHDIDELSAGEKEVLYGYLRLRNEAPKHSVILIDEPELHLNPRLIAGLASFYHRHLGRALDNQLWLVTHSDTLIREAVGQDGFSVYHMQPPGQYDSLCQATPVRIEQDLERLVVELVGDLAAYRPGAKLVVFEGGGDSKFDARMVSTLFPEFTAAVNVISGGDKKRVADLYSLLIAAKDAGYIPGKFYAITDSDGEPSESIAPATLFRWDVYHIENYLLEPKFILRVLEELNAATGPLASEEGVLTALRQSARETVPSLVVHQLRVEANKELIGCLNLGFDPGRPDPAVAIAEAVQRSRSRIEDVASSVLTAGALKQREDAIGAAAESDLENGRWRVTFRGRDVLRRFAHSIGNGIRYEMLRDLVLARMRDAECRPDGMASVLGRILADKWSST